MPRHQFTLADRKRGCAVAKGRAGGRKAQASGKAHKLTAEERRRGGLATAAKRKQKRLMDLLRMAGDAGVNAGDPRWPDATPEQAAQLRAVEASKPWEGLPPCRYGRVPAKPDAQDPAPAAVFTYPTGSAEIYLSGPAKPGSESPLPPLPQLPILSGGWDGQPEALAAYMAGASLAGKLMEMRVPIEEIAAVKHPVLDAAMAHIDPFTLSALKRFRLGPLSPLALTRSQRAQLQVIMDAGYLMATGNSMVQLTEKGRQAIEVDNG